MLLHHRSLRPRNRGSPVPREAPATASAVDRVVTLAARDPAVTSRHKTDAFGDDDALVPLTERQRALSRRLSKSCGNIKKYGNRLCIRRRQRHAERIVIEDVERMRQTLVAMDQRLTLLNSIALTMRQNALGAAMDMVTTYFHHMKHGLNPREIAYDRDVIIPFLEAVMAPDLKCQDFLGLSNFFRQWEYVTKYHAQIKMENSTLTPLPVESDMYGNDLIVIKATGVTHCRISRDTLVHFFPHIVQDDPLVQSLINKEYSYGYTMILHISHQGKVFQFESSIDLTSALFTLLSNPRATLQMVDSSMWTKAGNLRGEVHEQQIVIENGYLT